MNRIEYPLPPLLIFDLGGVLLNIDYHKTKNAFERYGIQDFDILFNQFNQTSAFCDFECGRISSQELLDRINRFSGLNLTMDQFETAWNAMLLDFPMERLSTLRALAKEHTLVLLSNTNAVHIQAFDAYLKSLGIFEAFYSLFDHVFLSHKVGLRKPDPAIFRHVLNTSKFREEEAFFIDDSPQHALSATTIGIRTHQLQEGENIVDLFSKYN